MGVIRTSGSWTSRTDSQGLSACEGLGGATPQGARGSLCDWSHRWRLSTQARTRALWGPLRTPWVSSLLCIPLPAGLSPLVPTRSPSTPCILQVLVEFGQIPGKPATTQPRVIGSSATTWDFTAPSPFFPDLSPLLTLSPALSLLSVRSSRLHPFSSEQHKGSPFYSQRILGIASCFKC